MRTAADIMTSKPKTTSTSEVLEDVVRLFLEQGVSSTPVIDISGEMIGMLSELTLVKAYMLHLARMHTGGKIANHTDLLDPVHFVFEDTPMSDVLKEILASPTHRVLVKNKKEKVVGIISPKDLMRALIGQLNPSQNIKEKLKETEEKLRIALEKVQTIEKHLEVYEQTFHETPYMMHAVDKDGKILMANRREHEMLGYNYGELVGKTILDLYAKPMHHEALQGLKKVIETGHHHITYTTLLKKNGTSLRCDISSSAIMSDKGEFISTISVLRPIDSDEMLRILNGIVDDKNGPLAKYLLNKES